MGAPPIILLDFVERRRPPSLTGWIVLAAGMLAVGAAIAEYATLQDAVHNSEARLAREERKLRRIAANTVTRNQKVSEAEVRRASLVAAALDRGLQRLLPSMESTAHRDIGLLGFELSGERGTVKLVGEARSLEALFDYTRRLGVQPGISAARLDGYEFRRSGAADIVQFNLVVHWHLQ